MLLEREAVQRGWGNRYPDEKTEDQIARYTKFFNDNWQRLEQALIELGVEPDNEILQGRIRSLTTLLELTTITIVNLRERTRQRVKR